METASNALLDGVSSIVSIFNESIVPMMTSKPLVYFLAAGLILTVIGIFAKARNAV